MHHFALVMPTKTPSACSSTRSRDWKPGDIIPQGPASLRVVDVIDPDALDDASEVGLLKVEHAAL